eukprot:sb/3465583/
MSPNLADLPINFQLRDNLPTCIEKLNPLQSQVIPIIMSGNDLLIGHVGPGKTTSHLIPMVHRVSVWARDVSQSETFALILTPTRDQAVQIEDHVKTLCRGISDMKTALIVGGQSMAQQEYRLKCGPQIVVATPGRLVELKPDLSMCFMVVIEECETLLGRSFYDQITSVTQLLPPRRQTIMVSNNVTEALCKLARPLLYHPTVVQVGEFKVCDVRQNLLWVEDPAKKRKLLDILSDKRFGSSGCVLVFVESKFAALLLADHLLNHDIICGFIHGDKTQEERNKIISDMEGGKFSVVVTTSVLGHGVLFPSVSVVVVFDLPGSVDVLVHQISRARVDKGKGTAFLFVNNTNKELFSELTDLAIRTGISIPGQLRNSAHLAYQRERGR